MKIKLLLAILGLVWIATLFDSCKKDDEVEIDYIEQAQKNKERGEMYLLNLRTQEGVKADPSGLLYEYIEYTRNPKPGLSDTVCVSYKGYTIAGQKFITKADTVMVEDLQKGLQIGVRHMGEKATYKLHVPYYLAYGASSNVFGTGKDTVRVLSYSPVVYELTLDSVIFVKK